MKNYLRKNFTLLLICLTTTVYGQTGGRDFSAIDAYVKSLGPLDSMTMGTINNVVSNHFEDKIDKARAIYCWIANNITYDVKAARSNSTLRNTPTDVLASRKAVGAGFASLFQDMCSAADIRCLTVDGFVKNNTEQIDEKGTEINHTWAVVQLGQSPDTWYYVDPAWGSGYCDAEMRNFTKYYSDAYFFTEKAIFNLQHFPDNEAWKLGVAPRNKKDFFGLPLIKTAALELGIKRLSPNDGLIKTKVSKSLNFSYTLNAKENISSVALGMGERKKYKEKPVNFSFANGILSFNYKFEEDGSFPLVVIVNGREFMIYSIEIN